ncbi:MAG: PepSY-like domain-containing protein [Planctomycetota bacterium]
MTKRVLLLSVISLSVFGMVTLVAWANDGQEQKVTLDQVPAAVKATILKESAGGKITEIESETKDGKTVYEAEFMLNGQEIDIKIAQDGTLLGREVEEEGDDEDDLTVDQVPGPARAALQKLAGDAKITGWERDKEHGVLIYEAEWVVNGAKHEAAVTADGTLVEIEEIITVKQAPEAVQAAIAKHFGDAKVVVEKKMIVVYGVEGKVNGKEKELLLYPTGQVQDNDGDDDKDDDGHHDNDDDDGDDDDD